MLQITWRIAALALSFLNLGISNTGGCKNGRYHGYGDMSYEDGGYYSGEWRNGVRNGDGTMKFSSDNEEGRKTYVGEWRNDVIQGFGIMTWRDTNPYNVTMYEGYWENDKEHGNGSAVWHNGDVYNGNWINGTRTGNGTMLWGNGGSYIGEFFDGTQMGHGIMIWADGKRYEGQFSKGSQNGNGTMIWANGDRYVGDFINGERRGYGMYNFSDGSFYIGEFKNNLLDGKGNYNYSNGNIYIGRWKHNEKHGNGTFLWKDGDIYSGEFKDDLRNGYGTLNYSNGNLYIGGWLKGEKNENGTFQYKNGSKYTGVWKEGKLISFSQFEQFYMKSESSTTNECEQISKSLKTGNVSIPWYIKSDDKTDMGVWNVWSRGITGQGVTVSVVDDGVSRCHPSIAANFDTKASYDFTDDDEDPSPVTALDWQGTKGASIIAAKRNEPVCTIGVAYNANIGGIRMLQNPVTDLKEAKSLSFQNEYIDIFQISWGPDDDGKTFDGPGPLTQHVLKDGAHQGRDGLGSIFVLASGTGGSKDDDCNADGYASSIYTISISSVDMNHTRPGFSERCAAILATAYSGERRVGTGLAAAAISADSCSLHDGTAASASIGTGIIALMLEANPSLGWRDVQHITVLSAQSERLLQADGWMENGAGLKVSHSFGFGIMDADEMVERATTWVPVGEQKFCETQAILITDTKMTVSVDCPQVSKLEHVQMGVKITDEDVRRGDISFGLSSPSGTKSTMISERRNDRSAVGFDTQAWPLMSTHFWGEDPTGNWTITLSVRTEALQLLEGQFVITCYGTSED
eukprot:GFUD01085990.1.p1 GENE.GFUD01085990.1~~GFUD01085990.1.p1  ORF type:complete len:800 (+),score=182.34 GFUD01085990.1:3-2402(+)